DCLALGMGPILEYGDRIEILPGRNGTQGIGLAHHPPRARIDRVHILNELVAQAALEQAGREGCDADGLKFFASLLVQAGHGLIAPFVLERAPMKHFRAPADPLWAKISMSPIYAELASPLHQRGECSNIRRPVSGVTWALVGRGPVQARREART